MLAILVKLQGQTTAEELEGAVSFITSQNVYIKFKSTGQISIGDTLFTRLGDQMVPGLVVNSLSSISAVCTPLPGMQFQVSDKITVKSRVKTAPAPPPQILESKAAQPAEATLSESKPPDRQVKTKTGKKNKTRTNQTAKNQLQTESPGGKPMEVQQDIYGRLSVSSYSNFSNTPGGSSQRMRYSFSLNAKNIANTKLSGESYISFAHKSGEWGEIQDNIYNGLKIYNLSLNYEPTRYFRILIGRKINPRISNMGAIDGAQAEIKFKSLTLGLIAGSRPDYEDYSLNFSLFQYGTYLSHDLVTKKGSMQSTLAYAEQKNKGNTDRRFLYFQHSNTLVRNLNFFGTIEFNLYHYDTVSESFQNNPNLSNLYLSLRYRIIKPLSISASYSSRQNIIYYETYKNYLDQVIDNEALKGLSVQVTYNPIRFLSVGVKGGYRYKKTDLQPSRNFYGYATYSRIPKIKVSSTLSVTLLETSYISGKIYSIGFSRDLLKNKLYCSLGYRYVDYKYFFSDYGEPQHLAEINLNWIIYKKLSFSANYEGTFEKAKQFTRLYVNLTQRF